MNKVIVARLSVKPEHINDFKGHAIQMVESTRKEPGCIIYTLYQEVNNSPDFIFYEEYTNDEAIQYHRGSAHFKQFGEKIGHMVTNRDVAVY